MASFYTYYKTIGSDETYVPPSDPRGEMYMRILNDGTGHIQEIFDKKAEGADPVIVENLAGKVLHFHWFSGGYANLEDQDVANILFAADCYFGGSTLVIHATKAFLKALGREVLQSSNGELDYKMVSALNGASDNKDFKRMLAESLIRSANDFFPKVYPQKASQYKALAAGFQRIVPKLTTNKSKSFAKVVLSGLLLAGLTKVAS